MFVDTKFPLQPPSRARSSRTLTKFLPPHLLLQVVYLTFPEYSLPDSPKIELQRKALYWLLTSLRRVDRTMYAACMHVLRSTHIAGYDRLVKSGHSSDPFPLIASPASSNANATPSPYAPLPQPSSSATAISPLSTIQRETAILDLFIALKVHEDVWADDTELHLERREAYKDLFDHSQPKARLEDLVRIYGERDGIVCVGISIPSTEDGANDSSTDLPELIRPRSPSASSSTQSLIPWPHAHPPPPRKPIKPSLLSSLFSKPKSPSSPTSFPYPQKTIKPKPIPFHLITITLSPRSAGLVLHPKRLTVVSTQRSKEEPLEAVARRLVGMLGEWARDGGDV
ncbi:hypothetical protein H0H87_012970 [Tephrocybe sp. NHM501043]|nr:hypothetical protein H0H87_012970 [Tephrocybe sp. NHM501043]